MHATESGHTPVAKIYVHFSVLPFFNLKYILFSPTNLGSVVEVSFNQGKNCVILDSDEEALLAKWQNLEEYMLKGNDSNDAWQLWPTDKMNSMLRC